MRLSMGMGALGVRYGDECAIEMMKKAGFDCVDFSCDCVPSEMYGDNYKEYIDKIRNVLKKMV